MNDFNFIAGAIALVAAGVAGLAVSAWALALIPAVVGMLVTGFASYIVFAVAGKIED